VITTALVVLHAFVTTRTVIGRQIHAVAATQQVRTQNLCVAEAVDPRKRVDPKRPNRGADVRRHGSGPSALLAQRRDPAGPPADICRE
jgi:hypothetical protein